MLHFYTFDCSHYLAELRGSDTQADRSGGCHVSGADDKHVGRFWGCSACSGEFEEDHPEEEGLNCLERWAGLWSSHVPLQGLTTGHRAISVCPHRPIVFCHSHDMIDTKKPGRQFEKLKRDSNVF